MNILDTDALSHLQKTDPIGIKLAASQAASLDPEFRITTISAYEMLKGAFNLIHELRKKHKDPVPGFQLFQQLFDYLQEWQRLIVPYDDAADQVYRAFTPRLRQELGNDARIAAIALAYGSAVWTCNVDDYKRVPGLIVYRAETGLRVT